MSDSALHTHAHTFFARTQSHTRTHAHTRHHAYRIRSLGPEGTFPDSPSFYPGMVFSIPNGDPVPPNAPPPQQQPPLQTMHAGGVCVHARMAL